MRHRHHMEHMATTSNKHTACWDAFRRICADMISTALGFSHLCLRVPHLIFVQYRVKELLLVFLIGLVPGITGVTASSLVSATVSLPATADPWLAGMPPTTTASVNSPEPASVAPTNSPVLISDI